MAKIGLHSQAQILDKNFREMVIKEITGDENRDRKQRELRKHEVYRDKTKKWVLEALAKEGLKLQTLRQMENRASNISICRKIVNKLARCYVGGVQRSIDGEQNQAAVDELERLLEVNQKMDKADKYRRLFYNTAIQVVPEITTTELDEAIKHKLKLRVFPPWNYDVIEDANDREVPKVYILTEFTERFNTLQRFVRSGTDGREARGLVPNFQVGDQKEQVIADNPEDLGSEQRQFIWWSETYHFTTNEKGEVIENLSPEDLLNPIARLPFVNIAEDQDGEFWAQGGEDLVDGSILINQLLTDMLSLAYIQGWGQGVASGKNLPKVLEGGPHNWLVFDIEHEGDPTPRVEYVSANPPLDSWMRMIEQYVALLLSTNNLSPSNIAGKLDASQFPSGISLLIEKSEATDSIEDAQKDFINAEKDLWDIIRRWQNLFFDAGALAPEFEQAGKIEEGPDVLVKFSDSKPILTEEQKLEMLKVRKELGINTEIELLQIDNPDLSDEEAEAKLLKIREEKLQKLNSAFMQAFRPGEESEQEQGTVQ